MCYYLNYFFLFSCIGHLIESFFYENGNSGILFGYWTPIYGIGILIILIIFKMVNKINTKIYFKAILLFFICSVLLSSIEVLGGYLIKLIFEKELWNYSNHIFSIGKYTSLEMSIIWGISSIIFAYILKPLSDKVVMIIPRILTFILTILFIVDCFSTLILK